MAKMRGKPPRTPQLGTHGLDDNLHAYATAWSAPEPDALGRLRRTTWTQVLKPQMLCDELQGRLLAMLSHMIQPQRVLELGTFTGYATACWTEGMPVHGTVDTVDVNDELHHIQDVHWKAMGLTDRIRRHTGRALDVLESGTLFEDDHRPFDVVFVDADKGHQEAYVKWAIEHVADGGWIVVDNVLWWGEVMRAARGEDTEIQAQQIHALNAFIQSHPELDNLILPLRDGLHVARRKPRR